MKKVQGVYNEDSFEIKNMQEKIAKMKNIVENVYRKYPSLKDDDTIQMYLTTRTIFLSCKKIFHLAMNDSPDISAFRSTTEAINKLREHANKLEKRMEKIKKILSKN